MSDRSTRLMRHIKAGQRAKKLPCWLCGQPIDYSADPQDGNAFSYDHIKPWSTHPDLRYDPANGASAHNKCNKARGNRPPSPGLGLLSEKW